MLEGYYRRCRSGHQYIWVQTNHFSCIGSQSVRTRACPMKVQLNISPINPTKFLKRFAECFCPLLRVRITLDVCHQNADAPHPLGRLRACSKRPRGRYNAEKRDEISPLHVPPRGPRVLRRLTIALCNRARVVNWLTTGVKNRWGPMSALGHKRTFAVQNVMSALTPKADMCSATRHVR